MDNEAKKQLARVKRLMAQGLSQRKISQTLKISKRKAAAMCKEIKSASIRGNRRFSSLSAFHDLIADLVNEGRSYETIIDTLQGFGRNFHKSSLSRYIQKHVRTKRPGEQRPGDLALVYVMTLKDHTCLFSCMLAYSRYFYLDLLHQGDVTAFIGCHFSCFSHIGGMPKRIRVCDMKCLHFSTEQSKDYERRMLQLGIGTEINAVKPSANCESQRRQVREKAIGLYFGDAEKIAEAVKSGHLLANNISIHQGFHKPVQKVFEEIEKPHLQPFYNDQRK